jgi:hypothetical protein
VFFLSLSGVVFVVVMQKVAACAMMIALCIMPSEISFLCMCFDSIYVDFVFTSFLFILMPHCNAIVHFKPRFALPV